MGKALKNPAFKEESFQKLKSQTLTGMKAEEKDVKAVSSRVLNALAYGKQHPLGEFETEESVQELTTGRYKNGLSTIHHAFKILFNHYWRYKA